MYIHAYRDQYIQVHPAIGYSAESSQECSCTWSTGHEWTWVSISNARLVTIVISSYMLFNFCLFVCLFVVLDVILCCVWAVLLVLGLVTQAVLLIVQETRFYKKQGQQNRQQVVRHGPDVPRIRYTGFPSRSLFRRLIDQPERPARVVRRTRRSDSTTRPLLSPNSSMVVRAAYGSVNT